MLTRIISLLPSNLRDNIRGIKRFNLFNRKYPKEQLLIYFADGKTFHGGLTDRFKGIISLYAFCKFSGIDFRIKFTSPFLLTTLLIPNQYDWDFSENEKISYNIWESKYMFLIGENFLNRLLNLKTNKQLHCLANRDIIPDLKQKLSVELDWGDYFKILFKPTLILRNRINEIQFLLDNNYISIVFRFQNLLGDFEEYGKPSLDSSSKETLIRNCLHHIELIKSRNECNILVTSDSEYFLHLVKDINGVFAFPEKVVHIDNSKNEKIEVHMKSFVDFFLLAEGSAIYSIGTKEMYRTEFPEYAAKLNKIKFERILI